MSKPETYKVGGGWGNAIQWVDFDKGRVNGWKSRRPRIGDLLEAEMQSGKIGVFRFETVDYCPDPPDMFFATVSGVGYKETKP